MSKDRDYGKLSPKIQDSLNTLTRLLTRLVAIEYMEEQKRLEEKEKQ